MGEASTSGWEIDYERAEQFTPYGVRVYKTADVERLHAAGSYGAPDYQGPLVFTFPIIKNDTPANLDTAVKTLLGTTWAPGTSNETLTINMGGSDFTASGRPRNPEVNVKNIAFGEVTGLLVFVGLTGAIS